MCGIGGIYNPSVADLPLHEVEDLWDALSDRGTHACGFSFLEGGASAPKVWKDALSASVAVGQGVLRQEVSPGSLWALLHTRYTTQGSTSNNDNNHPVISDGIILTHNGVIQDDRSVFRAHGVHPRFEVDSEAINVGLRYGGLEWVAENVEGSMSIAWVDYTKSTETVNLFTNGLNPLVIGRTSEGMVVWASNLYHLDAFDLSSHFNAAPYKHYQISAEKGHAVIRSEYVSDQRYAPVVLGRYSHASSWQSLTPSKTVKKAKRGRKGGKAPKNHGKGKVLIEKGFRRRSDGSWTRATPEDWAALYDDMEVA